MFSIVDRIVARYRGIWPVFSAVLTTIGIAYVAASILGWTSIGGCDGPIVACDAASYYYVDDSPYEWSDSPPGVPPFRYAPAFLWVLAPFQLLSFDGFVWLWAAMHVIVLIWLRAGWMLAIPGFNEDVIRGNINVFIAALMVLAVRHGAAWAPILLTKVTPVVGLLWHAIRREWTSVAVAYTATVGVAAVGIMLSPNLWLAWMTAVFTADENYAGVNNVLPLSLRIVIGASVVGVAALRRRAWALPVGILAAWPGLLPPALMILAAIPRLRATDTGPADRGDAVAPHA